MSRPGFRRSSGAGRTLLGFGVVLAGLLAIVAVASSGDLSPGTGAGKGRPDVPAAVFSYLYASFLVAAVIVLPLAVYLYVREREETPRRSRRGRQLAPLTFVLIVGLVYLIASRWPDGFSDLLERIRLGDGNGRAADQAREAALPPGVPWVPLAVVSGVTASAFAAFAGWHVAHRRRRPFAPRASLAAVLSETLDGTLDDLRADPDVRRSIIRAYARMETALQSCGVARREAEAPLEYLERVLLELDVSPQPVLALTELFEQAKFSDHALGPELKESAIDSLEAIRTELRALV